MVPPFRLVLLCQESDRPGLVTEAVRQLGANLPVDVQVLGWSVGTLMDHAEAVARGIAGADVVLISHLLMDESVRLVEPLLDAHLRPDAQLLVLASLWPLMRRTRLGKLRLDEKALSRLLPGGLPPGGTTDLSATLRGLVQRASELRQRLPDGAQDLRVLLGAYARWSSPSPQNLAQLVLELADVYGPIPGVFRATLTEPEAYPTVGVYHPSVGIVEDLGALPPHEGPGGTIGLLLMRGPLVAGHRQAADGWIRLCERKGFRVIPAFAESFDFRDAITRYFDPSGVDLIIAATGFPLVGGHNRVCPDDVSAFLKARNIPYLATTSLMVQDTASWHRSPMGLSPMEVAMQTAVFELEGGIEPLVVQGMAEQLPEAKQIIESRADQLLDRVARWRRLQTLPRSEVRLVLTVFAFPPGKGAVGTAAYLDVFRSAHGLLQRLSDEGYRVHVPETAEALLRMVVADGDPHAPMPTADLAVGDRLSVADYERIAPEHDRVARMWGPAPGRLQNDGKNLFIHGVALGNVFLGVQPSFGFEGDPMRLLFERGATPHHGFLAYYRWAEQIFRADALVHLGTHGALEFMPGKHVGLDGTCWPDVLVGTLPHLYIYAVNNPSEGTIAKRRGYGVTVGHLTPPSDQAGLHRAMADLRSAVRDYITADTPSRREAALDVLKDAVIATHFDQDVPPCPSDDPIAEDGWVRRVEQAILEVEERRIPVGLHILGRLPSAEEEIEILTALGIGDGHADGLRGELLTADGFDPTELDRRFEGGDAEAIELIRGATETVRRVCEALVREGRDQAERLLPWADPQLIPPGVSHRVSALLDTTLLLRSGDEMGGLLNALRGGYVPPGPGGDPARHRGVLPVGRNLHALDPAAIPTPVAWRRGVIAADALLSRHRTTTGRPLRRLGLVLWGLDNIKTQGETIAQAFHLLGVRPKANSIGRITSTEVVPLHELGRPRVDVTLTTSGIFRDIFGLHLEILDRAVRSVADLDEPLDMNPIRAKTLELVDQGFDRDVAQSRVFSNAPGAYGTYIDHLVQQSRWEERKDLAESFARRKSFVFGSNVHGEAQPELLRSLARDLELTAQNLDSAEISLTDVDHYFEYLGGLTALAEAEAGQRPAAWVLDATNGPLRLRDVESTLRLETRARLLNPRWFEGLLAHGFEGVEEIRKRVEYTFGWSATTDAVSPWVYDEIHQTYLSDSAVRERMQSANPHAFLGLVERIQEAHRRGFWHADADQQQLLEELQRSTDDALEGIVPSSSEPR